MTAECVCGSIPAGGQPPESWSSYDPQVGCFSYDAFSVKEVVEMLLLGMIHHYVFEQDAERSSSAGAELVQEVDA